MSTSRKLASDWLIALTRALTEAAQTRLGYIQGGREDLPDFAPAHGKPPEPTWNRWGGTISFDDIASHEHASVNEDIEFILGRMRQSGFDQVVVVGEYRASFAGVEILTRLKTEASGFAVGANLSAAPLRQMLLTRVFHDGDPAPAADLQDGVEIGGRAAELIKAAM